jgi:hemerythrin
MPTPFIAWTEEMRVSVTSLDNEHKKLIAIINELHDGIMAGHKKDVLEAVLNQLVQYARFHFANEEELFLKAGYAGAPVHKLEHESFIGRISNMQARIKTAPTVMLGLELMAFLRNWLLTHIQGSDKKYGSSLNSHGIF